MIQQKASPEAESMDSDTEPSKRFVESLLSSLNQVWVNALEAWDAQLSISALKTARLAIIVAGAVLALIALTAVSAYAFYLLDSCLAYALSRPDFPVWFAPLMRGLAYLLCSMAGLAYLWHTMVGFGQVSEESAAISAVLQK